MCLEIGKLMRNRHRKDFFCRLSENSSFYPLYLFRYIILKIEKKDTVRAFIKGI